MLYMHNPYSFEKINSTIIQSGANNEREKLEFGCLRESFSMSYGRSLNATVVAELLLVGILVSGCEGPAPDSSGTYTVFQNDSLSFNIAENTDANDSVQWGIVQRPIYGDLLTSSLLPGSPVVTYMPNSVGTENTPVCPFVDSFTYTTEGGSTSDVQTIEINVLCASTADYYNGVKVTNNKLSFGDQNSVPVAANMQFQVLVGQDQQIQLSGYDSDEGPSSLSFELTSNAVLENGVLAGIAPDLHYFPAADCPYRDEFNYRVFDGLNYSTTATVVLYVACIY